MVLGLSVQAANPGKADKGSPTRFDPCGTEEIKCTGRDSGSLLPFPENCTQYLRCTGKRLHVKDCPDGQFFDNVSLSCRKEEYQCQSPCPKGAYVRGLQYSADAPISSAVDNVTSSPQSLDVTGNNDIVSTTGVFNLTSTQVIDNTNTGSGQSATSTVHPDTVSNATIPQSFRAFQTTITRWNRQTESSGVDQQTTVSPVVIGATSASAKPFTPTVPLNRSLTTDGQQTKSTQSVTSSSRSVTAPSQDVVTGTPTYIIYYLF